MPAGRPRSEAARHAILTATHDELADRGYDKLSIDRIAMAAGVGKQTVYRWYPSKTALVAECLLRGYVSAPQVEIGLDGSARDDVADWARAFAMTLNEPATLSLIRAASAAAAADGDVAHRFQEQFGLSRSALVDRLRRGEEAGQVRAGTAAGAAELIVGSLLHRLLTRQTITTGFVQELIDLVFAGIDRQLPLDGYRRS